MSRFPLTLVAASAALVVGLSACNRADTPAGISSDPSPAQFDQRNDTMTPATQAPDTGQPEPFLDTTPPPLDPNVAPPAGTGAGEGVQPLGQPLN